MPYDDPTSASLQPLAVAAGVAAVAYLAGSYLFPSLTGKGYDGMAKGLNGSTPATIPGLQNWGNWCFANAVLQALSSSPALRAFLAEQVLKADIDTDSSRTRTHKSSGSTESTSDSDSDSDSISSSGTDSRNEKADPDALLLTSTLWQLLSNLTRERAGRRSTTLTSMPVVRALSYTLSRGVGRGVGNSGGRRLQGYVEQQDAQEFVQLLSEALSAECNGTFPATQSLSQLRATRRTAYIPLPFEGRLSTTLTCATCRTVQRTSTAPFVTLTVHPTPPSSSLEDAVAQATNSVEKIDDYACFTCTCKALEAQAIDTTPFKTARLQNPDYDLPKHITQQRIGGPVKGVVIRRTALADPPRLLCVHVQRSVYGGGGSGSWFGGSGGASRSGVCVRYGKRLVVGDGDKYDLKAIVTHRGHHDRGHYVCVRRVRAIHPAAEEVQKPKPTTRWYAVSDETVNQITPNAALDYTNDIFLAFYERVDHEAIAAAKKARRRTSSAAKAQAASQVDGLAEEAAALKLDGKPRSVVGGTQNHTHSDEHDKEEEEEEEEDTENEEDHDVNADGDVEKAEGDGDDVVPGEQAKL